MQCHIDTVQIILRELTQNKARRLMEPGFYLAYVLAHDISYLFETELKRQCNITLI